MMLGKSTPILFVCFLWKLSEVTEAENVFQHSEHMCGVCNHRTNQFLANHQSSTSISDTPTSVVCGHEAKTPAEEAQLGCDPGRKTQSPSVCEDSARGMKQGTLKAKLTGVFMC